MEGEDVSRGTLGTEQAGGGQRDVLDGADKPYGGAGDSHRRPTNAIDPTGELRDRRARSHHQNSVHFGRPVVSREPSTLRMPESMPGSMSSL